MRSDTPSLLNPANRANLQTALAWIDERPDAGLEPKIQSRYPLDHNPIYRRRNQSVPRTLPA